MYSYEHDINRPSLPPLGLTVFCVTQDPSYESFQVMTLANDNSPNISGRVHPTRGLCLKYIIASTFFKLLLRMTVGFPSWKWGACIWRLTGEGPSLQPLQEPTVLWLKRSLSTVVILKSHPTTFPDRWSAHHARSEIYSRSFSLKWAALAVHITLGQSSKTDEPLKSFTVNRRLLHRPSAPLPLHWPLVEQYKLLSETIWYHLARAYWLQRSTPRTASEIEDEIAQTHLLNPINDIDPNLQSTPLAPG